MVLGGRLLTSGRVERPLKMSSDFGLRIWNRRKRALLPWDVAQRPLAHVRPRRAAAQDVFEFRISNFEIDERGHSCHGMLRSGRLLTSGRVERPLRKPFEIRISKSEIA
jgi:hypothetical protein